MYDGPLDAGFREEVGIYAGQEVTLLAAVADVLSPRTFTITAPDGCGVEPLLVVATQDADVADMGPGTSVLVAGTPARDFDTEAVAGQLDLDLGEEEYEEWHDDTHLVATVVEPAS